MTREISAVHGEHAATVVGVITTIAGVALLSAPDRVGPLIGVSERGPARGLGAVDLALVPGLLRGQPRWPWLAARAVTNLCMAAYVLRRPEHRPGLLGRARAFGALMCLATLGDSFAVRGMRRDRQGGGSPR